MIKDNVLIAWAAVVLIVCLYLYIHPDVLNALGALGVGA